MRRLRGGGSGGGREGELGGRGAVVGRGLPNPGLAMNALVGSGQSGHSC